MRSSHVIGLGFGALLLLGAGIASLSRAQQPGNGPDPAYRDRQVASQDPGALEAEVERLQIEHDVARGELHEFLKKYDHFELLRESDFVSPIGMALLFEREFLGSELMEEKSAIGRTLALADEANKKEIDSAASRDQKKIFDWLHAARDRRRKDFLQKTRELNDKKRALSEARQPSQREAR